MAKNPQRSKRCDRCQERFTTRTADRTLCHICDPSKLVKQSLPLGGDHNRCETCQHGYQYQPGAWGCAINAHRLCKPELFAKRWMRRQVTTGRTA